MSTVDGLRDDFRLTIRPSDCGLADLVSKFNLSPNTDRKSSLRINKVVNYSSLAQFLIFCDVCPNFAEAVRRHAVEYYRRASPEVGVKSVIISFRVRVDQIRIFVDRYWNSCILKLLLFQMELEDSLSWLSTLGGAFSSYGEFNLVYAQKAQRVSFNQLKLAKTHGDPNLISRALIYICYAGCQQGFKPLVKHFIHRQVQPYISSIPAESRDRIVEQMYYGLCYRVKHFY